MNETQPDLFAPKAKPLCRDHDFLVKILTGKDWMTAEEILRVMGLPGTDSQKRSLRNIASNSDGAVAGGQRGYKLVSEMTVEEYQHWRNWMKSQADEMTRRILAGDKIFYRRKPVEVGNGIL